MTLQQQVCSLELAKRLKELGVKQNSLFYWSEGTMPATLWWLPSLERNDFYPSAPHYSAFTVAELGEMLPRNLYTKSGEEHHIVCFFTNEEASIGYETIGYRHPGIDFIDAPTEADARAKMLIYLLENKLITL